MIRLKKGVVSDPAFFSCLQLNNIICTVDEQLLYDASLFDHVQELLLSYYTDAQLIGLFIFIGI